MLMTLINPYEDMLTGRRLTCDLSRPTPVSVRSDSSVQPARVGGSTHKSSIKIAYSGQRSHIRPSVSVSVSW